MKIAIQGERGAYSECAALDFFSGQPATIVPCRDYIDLFEAVRLGEADAMAIPIENSTAGSVYQYYDLLLEYATRYDFRIWRESKLRIRHNLIGIPGARLEEIREVRSHYQALDQCEEFLRRHDIRRVTMYDTAGAVQQVAAEGRADLAAIASVQAAKDNGLAILAPDIQDQNNNSTRFLVVAPPGRLPEPEMPPVLKGSVVFCIPNEDGSLFRAMAAFGSRPGVSIIRMESRPLIGTAWSEFIQTCEADDEAGTWDLLYYVDFLTPAARAQAVIEHLSDLVLCRRGTRAVQLLGLYAKGPMRNITGTPWR